MSRKPLLDYSKFGPLKQGAFSMLLVTLISLVCFAFQIRSIKAWTMILSPIFFFIFYNPILGVFQQKLLQYFGLSMISFFSLVTYIYISGNFVSGTSFMQLDELHWITKAVAIFYFMLNLICLLFRGIIYMLEQLDE